ncbi:hypothetical protein TNCV_1351621 [Trichonephila clavipes]|nr:hypothetical protein TNCV_1351621 [Trichonephila clavipes]
MWFMVAQRLTQITPPAATPAPLLQRVEAAWAAVPQEHIQNLFESMMKRVAAGMSPDHREDLLKRFSLVVLGISSFGQAKDFFLDAVNKVWKEESPLKRDLERDGNRKRCLRLGESGDDPRSNSELEAIYGIGRRKENKRQWYCGELSKQLLGNKGKCPSDKAVRRSDLFILWNRLNAPARCRDFALLHQ